MDKHIMLVGILNIAMGVIGLVIAIIIFAAVVGGGILSGDEDALMITSIVGTTVAGLIVILSIPGIIGGAGVLRHHNWARILVLIISAIELLNIPIGTIIGIYSIWTLIQDETIHMFMKTDQNKK